MRFNSTIFNTKNVISFSLFAKDPDVQTQHFGHMKTDADLEKHGVRVMNAIGALVRACVEADDGRLVEKIHEVHTVSLIKYTVCKSTQHNCKKINLRICEFIMK